MLGLISKQNSAVVKFLLEWSATLRLFTFTLGSFTDLYNFDQRISNESHKSCELSSA